MNHIQEGCFPTKDMQTPPLRSGYLDIKDKMHNELKLKMCYKNHIISYRVSELWAFKRSKKMRKNLNLLQKRPNLQIILKLILKSFFAQMIFFMGFLVFKIWSILYYSLFNTFRNLKKNIKKLSGGLRPPPGLRPWTQHF